MAEEAIKKLEEQLSCSICLDSYTDPKVLQCLHIYCQQCLVSLVGQDQQDLTCPACRQVTPVPDRGVAGLPPAFHINRLIEIQNSFKKLGNPAAALEGAVGGATVNEAPSRNVGRCFEHGEEYKLYCETCEELICWKCPLKGFKHHDHDYEELDRAFKRCENEITSSLEPMETQVATIKKALAQFDVRHGEISDQRAAIADNIYVTFRRLRDALNVRETELISQLDQVTQNKLKVLAAQKDQIETTLAQLCSCLHFMRESLRAGNKVDMLIIKPNLTNQVKELTTPFQPDLLKPNTKANIIFAPSEEVQDCGCLLLSNQLLDPSRCSVAGPSVEVAAVGEKCKTVVQTFNFEGKPTEDFIKALHCELQAVRTGTGSKCSVKRRGQSQYEISFQPTIKGRHQLHITVKGQHIRGSPFSIAVKSPVEKLGTPILTIDGLGLCGGVAVNRKGGEVVVSEWERHCVSVFSPSGERLRSFGTRGSGLGQFDHPSGVAMDGEGNILVADSENHRIQKLAMDGRFLAASPAKFLGPQKIASPIGIALNSKKNQIYVIQNHCCHILNSDLTFFSTFGKEGSGKGQFKEPRDVACDSTGKVYVADTGNHRIQVFTAEGKFLRVFGRHGQGKRHLDWPFGVAIDSSDMVYVSDRLNYRVAVLTSEGHFVMTFGRKGEGPGEFELLGRLAIDSCGIVYACDSCLKMF